MPLLNRNFLSRSQQYRHSSTFSIPLHRPYSLRLTALSHGWVNLLPFEWDSKREVINRVEYLSVSGASVSVSINQVNENALSVLVAGNTAIGNREWEELLPRLRRSLSVDEDLAPVHALARKFDRKVLSLLEMGGGRLLRGTSFFEDVVKTLLTTNASWDFTRSMVRNLIALYGRHGAFPSISDLVNVTEADFRTRGRIGYRARYLIAIVRQFADMRINETLPGIRFMGLGEYGATHAAVLRGNYSRIPIDSEVRSYCRLRHKCKEDSDIYTKFERWGDYAFLGYKLGRQARSRNWIGEARRAPNA